MRWLRRGRSRFFQGQMGFTLLEALVAVAILAFIGVVFMSAMNTSFRSAGIQDEQVTAESLARTQLEEIKAATYTNSYNVTVEMPSQYSLTIESPYVSWNDADDVPPDVWIESGNNTGLQKITVRVSSGGKALVMVEALKVE